MTQTSTSAYSNRLIYRRLLTWVQPHWRIFALGVLGMVCTAATEPLFPALMKHLLDSGFVAKDERDIVLIPAAMIGIFIFRGVSTYMSGYSMAWVAARVVLDLRQAMFRRLLSLPTGFYDDQSTGVLISKVAYDVTNVTQAATGVLTTVIRDSLTILGLLGFLLYLDWKLTLIALTVGPVILGVIKIFSKRLRAASRSGYSAMGLITHILEEAVGAHKVVKIFGGQTYEAARFDEATNVYRRATMREAAAAAATVPLTQVAASTSVAIITYLALRQSAGPGGTTVGEFLSFITALLMLLAPVKRLTDVSNPLQRGLARRTAAFNRPFALRAGRFHLSWRASSRTRGCQSRNPAGPDRGAGRPVGKWQDVNGGADSALLSPQFGASGARWTSSGRPEAGKPARQYRAGQPGCRAV